MSFIDRTILAHMVDPMRQTLGISDFQMSLILGPVFAASYSVAAIGAGWAVDRFDRRIVIGSAMMLWSVMTIACGFASSIMWLAAARMMVAVGEAFVSPTAIALIGDRFPPSRLSSGLAVFGMGAKAGTSAAFFAAAAAFAAAYAIKDRGAFAAGFEVWQIVLILVALPGLILAFAPLTFREPRGARKTAVFGDVEQAEILPFLKEHRRFLIPFVFATMGVAITSGALLAWLPTFMQRIYGWKATQYGPIVGTVTAAAALLTLPQAIFVDRLVSRGITNAPLRYMSWVLALGLPFAVAAFLMTSPILFLVCIAAIVVLVQPYPVYVNTTLQLIAPPALRGRLTGLLVAVIPLFSQGLGPVAIGAMTDFVFEDPMMIGIALGIVISSGILISIIFLRIAAPRMHAVIDSIDASRGVST
jgi:MFS family permease